MDYPLCLRSPKPLSPAFNVISARINISSKPITLLHHHFPTNVTLSNSKRSININSHFCTNYKLYPRANGSNSSPDDHRLDDVATRTTVRSRPVARGAGASIAVACVLGVLCCGAALVIGPPKAAAKWPFTTCESCGGSGVGKTFDDHSINDPMSPKGAVISLSKVKRFFDQKKVDPNDSAIRGFDLDKKNALIKIKKGENIESAFKTMQTEKGMKGDVGLGSYEIKIAALEILIAQGKFNNAFDMLKSLEKEGSFNPSDPRLPLYKAIIYSIRFDKDHSPEDYWEEFFKMENSPFE